MGNLRTVFTDWKNPENAQEGDMVFIIPKRSMDSPKNPTNGARWEDKNGAVREYLDGIWLMALKSI